MFTMYFFFLFVRWEPQQNFWFVIFFINHISLGDVQWFTELFREPTHLPIIDQTLQKDWYSIPCCFHIRSKIVHKMYTSSHISPRKRMIFYTMSFKLYHTNQYSNLPRVFPSRCVSSKIYWWVNIRWLWKEL